MSVLAEVQRQIDDLYDIVSRLATAPTSNVTGATYTPLSTADAITGGASTGVTPSSAIESGRVGDFCIVGAYTTSAEIGEVSSTTNITPIGGGTFTNSHATGASIYMIENYTIPASAFLMKADNGATDNGARLQALFDALPAAQTAWSGTLAGRANAFEIQITPTSGSDYYGFSTKVTTPKAKNYALRGGLHGVRFKWTGSGDYLLRIGDQTTTDWRSVLVEGIAFEDGGIEIQKEGRGYTGIRLCRFENTGDYAVKFLGESCVTGEFVFCEFSQCAGSISCDHANNDLFTVSKSSFVRSTDTDILLSSTGWSIEDNDFETRNTSNYDKPWIALKVGDIKVTKNRFGDEVTTGYAPPREAIVIGPVGSTSSTAVLNILINENYFGGTNGTPTANEADSALRLNAPVQQLRMVDNTINDNYNTAIINEAMGDSNVYISGHNEYRGNTIPIDWETNTIFSRGGYGFNKAILVPHGAKVWQNLVRRTNAMAASTLWVKSGVTVTKNATGPDGVANSAFTVNKTTAVASGTVRAQIMNTASNVSGGMCATVFAKAGTVDRMRVYFYNSTDGINLSGVYETIQLTNDWREYHMVLPEVDTAKTYIFYIGVGHISDIATTGTILIANPQVVDGFGPAPFHLPNIDSGGNIHAPLSFQGFVIGNAYHDYGSAAPTTGRYEVGDVFWYPSPAADTGPNMTTTTTGMGFVCTTAGSAGTWKVWGDIKA